MDYQGSKPDQFHIGSAFSFSAIAGFSLRTGLTSLVLLTGITPVLAGSNATTQASLSVGQAQAIQLAQVGTTIIYVNSALGKDEAGAGVVGAPYRTLTYALQRAQAGTVVQLAAGSYTKDTGETFPLVVPPGVILRGDEASKGQTILVIGGGIYISPTFARQNVTVRAEKDSEIRGLTLTNPNTRGTALWIESTNPTVKNNTFTNSDREGIFITGTASPTVADNLFTRNHGNGISIARTASGEIRNNQFQDTGFGLAIGGNATTLLEGNSILQNTDGLYLNDSARPVLRKNIIENNTRDGIVATGNAQPNLGTADSTGSNRIRNNGRYDINNGTSNTIAAVGNDIDTRRVVGKIDFVAAEVPGGSSFSDVQGHWAQAYIQALAAKGVITGFPDGTFRPGDPVTRAQFATIISKAFNPPVRRPPINFTDVRSNFWAYQVIQSAYQGGFVAGYPEGVFLPDQRIPRVQVLVALANGLGFGNGSQSALSIYTDAAQIPSYAVGPVAAATQRRVVVNYPTLNQLNPNREATRAEVAAIVYQALVNAGKADAIASPYIVQSP